MPTSSLVVPPLLDIAKQWFAECVTCKVNTFPQLLLLGDSSTLVYRAPTSPKLDAQLGNIEFRQPLPSFDG